MSNRWWPLYDEHVLIRCVDGPCRFVDANKVFQPTHDGGLDVLMFLRGRQMREDVSQKLWQTIGNVILGRNVPSPVKADYVC